MMMKRLRPYGKVTPEKLSKAHLAAWILGIRDGWEQPYELSTSYNVDHLGDVQESLDRGANLGQWLRSPLNHQQRDRS